MERYSIDSFILDERELAEHYKESGNEDGYKGKSKLVEFLEELKSYKKAEENEMLKMLPCRIDDEMWAIRHYRGVLTVQKGFVSEMYFTKEMKLMIVVKHVARGVFGEKVFLTREEAEQALAKMKGV